MEEGGGGGVEMKRERGLQERGWGGLRATAATHTLADILVFHILHLFFVSLLALSTCNTRKKLTPTWHPLLYIKNSQCLKWAFIEIVKDKYKSMASPYS